MAKIIKEKLVADKAQFAQLQQEFNANAGKVYAALAYRSYSESAKAIRARAMEMGVATNRTFIK